MTAAILPEAAQMSIQTAETKLAQPMCAAEVLEHSQRQVVSTDYSALSAQNFLLLHVDAKGLGEQQQRAVADWLRRLPCPVLGIALDTQASIIGDACDVLLDETVDAALLVANIRRTPIAATVLVQLLRAVGHLPLESALVAESMAYATLQSGAEFRHWLEQRPQEASEVLIEPG
ncbi:MAG: enoyl-CoA hydratase/isomerase family protein, partial [Nevskia sp.]|nr:enoyl-CoA hydratase/isomerase family protein [Nevskia sp.]